jgi:hypothetical protein
MIQIKKSRLGRQGDQLVVERDEDFAYSVWDYTPTERREDQGQGDPEPNTMALRLVKDRVLKARGENGDGNDRVTAKEVWEQLVGEITGQGRKAPSSKTVRRWLDRWVANGVLVEGKKRIVPGSDKPVTTYTLPPSSSRALSMQECPLVVAPRNPLQEQEKAMDNRFTTEHDVHCSTDACPDPESKGQRPGKEQDVPCPFPVTEGDLEEQRLKDSPTRTTRACACEAEVVEAACEFGEQAEAPPEVDGWDDAFRAG